MSGMTWLFISAACFACCPWPAHVCACVCVCLCVCVRVCMCVSSMYFLKNASCVFCQLIASSAFPMAFGVLGHLSSQAACNVLWFFLFMILVIVLRVGSSMFEFPPEPQRTTVFPKVCLEKYFLHCAKMD